MVCTIKIYLYRVAQVSMQPRIYLMCLRKTADRHTCECTDVFSAATCCRDLLAAPLQTAQELLQGRMPVPKLLECDQAGSQVIT